MSSPRRFDFGVACCSRKLLGSAGHAQNRRRGAGQLAAALALPLRVLERTQAITEVFLENPWPSALCEETTPRAQVVKM